jgi:Metalloenzyme superfamily
VHPTFEVAVVTRRGAAGLFVAAVALLLVAVAVPARAGRTGGDSAAASGATAAADPAPRPLETRNVIFITLDGLRIQELFGGMDPVVSGDDKKSGIYDLKRARQRFWRETPEERRLALMPFFWGTLAPQGIVLGNSAKGSRVTPNNPLLYSEPGYAEILTGQYQKGLTSFEGIRSPAETFMEYAQRRLGLGAQEVAVVGSWGELHNAAARQVDPFFINAGYEDLPADLATPRMRVLSDAQHDIMALWEEGRSDAVTMGIALDYLTTVRPRLLWIALDESDDWAHARRYDRLLDLLQVYDNFLRRLWEAIESMDGYRGHTTIVMTTDHGRGRTARDWVDHGEKTAGSEEIWCAVIGPDAPRQGEARATPSVRQSDVAATILRLLGLEARDWNPAAGPPIRAAFR